MKKHNTPLTVKVVDGQLVICIGVDTLACAVAAGDVFHHESNDEEVRHFAITDTTRFAKEVAIAMDGDEEDGSSLLTDFIERAAQAAIDDGSEGCECDRRILHGEKDKDEKF